MKFTHRTLPIQVKIPKRKKNNKKLHEYDEQGKKIAHINLQERNFWCSLILLET